MDDFPQLVLEAHHLNPRSCAFDYRCRRSDDCADVGRPGDPEMSGPMTACISYATAQFILQK